ncbi:MAG: hypothetical protein ACLT3Y_04095 [Ruminococcus callidus]
MKARRKIRRPETPQKGCPRAVGMSRSGICTTEEAIAQVSRWQCKPLI